MALPRSQPGVPQKPMADSSQNKPEVIFEVIFERGLLSFCLRNIGTRPAMKVSVTFDKKIVGPSATRNGDRSHKAKRGVKEPTGREISALPLFRKLEFLGPGREISTFVDTSSSYFRRRQPTKIIAKVTYADPEGHKFESTIKHDLEIFRELSYLVN